MSSTHTQGLARAHVISAPGTLGTLFSYYPWDAQEQIHFSLYPRDSRGPSQFSFHEPKDSQGLSSTLGAREDLFQLLVPWGLARPVISACYATLWDC